ncbi:MAG: hypothetical protein J6I79_05400 [Paludibacteraceae bacterium]|nr:hypothetical protein [Paludibacteraceae bacterium]
MLLPFLAGVLSQGLAARRSARTARQQQQLLQQQAAAADAHYYQQLHHSGADGPQAQAQLALVRQLSEKQNGSNANTALAGNLTREQQLAGNQQTARNVATALNQLTVQTTATQRQLSQEHLHNQQLALGAQQRLKQQQAENRSRLGQHLARSLVTALAYRNRAPTAR